MNTVRSYQQQLISQNLIVFFDELHIKGINSKRWKIAKTVDVFHRCKPTGSISGRPVRPIKKTVKNPFFTVENLLQGLLNFLDKEHIFSKQ